MRTFLFAFLALALVATAYLLTRKDPSFKNVPPGTSTLPANKESQLSSAGLKVAELSPPGESAGTGTVSGKDERRRADMVAAESDFREIVARNIALDYAPFLSRLSLSPEKRDLILQALADQFSAANDREKGEYDALLHTLLGDANFTELANYRARLPAEKQAAAGLAALKSALPDLGAAEETTVRKALDGIPPIHPLALAVVQQARISDADIERVVASYEKLFDDAFAGASIDLPARTALREWYLRQHIQTQMNVLKTQQMMLERRGGG